MQRNYTSARIAFIAVIFCCSPCFADPEFTDQTLALTGGLTDAHRSAWGDYNGDGYVDFLCGGKVYRNNGPDKITGKWSFTEVFYLPGGVAGIWADYNNDGRLDIYSWARNEVFRNTGGDSFTAVAMPTLSSTQRYAASWVDYNNDGYVDLYVSGGGNSNQPNAMMMNNGGVSFTKSSDGGGGNNRGVTSCDFDRDGDQDIYVSSYWSGNTLLRNDPTGFTSAASEHGVFYEPPAAGYTGGSAWGDFDNDGNMDLFVANLNHGAQDNSLLYGNLGAAGLSGLNGSYGAAWADFDNDGDLDLCTQSKIFVNAGNSNHWLKVHLTGDGTRVNKAAIGSTVRITVNGKTMTRQVEGSTGVGNQNDLTLHFGLGQHNGPVDLEITSPDGASWTVQGVAVDQTVAYVITVSEVQTPGRKPHYIAIRIANVNAAP